MAGISRVLRSAAVIPAAILAIALLHAAGPAAQPAPPRSAAARTLEDALATAGTIPEASDYWVRVDLQHSVEALNIAEAHTTDPRYEKHHGPQALATRRAYEALAESLTAVELTVTESR